MPSRPSTLMRTKRSQSLRSPSISGRSLRRTRRKACNSVALEQLREGIQKQVGNEAEEIVDGLIEEAKKGYCNQAKFLFEMIGLYPATVGEEPPEEDSLAKTLLHRLGFPDGPTPETEVTSEGDRQETAAKSDAVE